MNGDEQDQLFVAAGQVFQPATPIRTRELFSGRIIQIARVADAVGQSGLHVAVYGERGVGKTSLANILNDIPLHTEMATARVNCDGTDTFTSAWRKLALRLYLTNGNRDTAIPDLIRPDGVVLMLDGLERPAVCIFDEFDRMPRSEARIFSDLIKSLSDNAVSSTVVLVGVAETVTDLVEEHASIERALVQVQMPRMENAELQEILEKAAEQLEVTFSDKALEQSSDYLRGSHTTLTC